MKDLPLTVDRVDLEQGEVLFPVAANLDIGLENIRGVRGGIKNVVDPLDDFLLLGHRELLIEFAGGHIGDFRQSRGIEKFHRVVGDIDDEDTHRIGLLIDLLEIIVVTSIGNDEGDDQNNQ